MENNNELLDLSGKCAIVTGGAKGIGLGIVKRLARSGAKVLIADLDESALVEVEKELDEEGYSVASIVTDVSNENDIKDMVQTCVSDLGSLDILVNNAGIFPSKAIAEMTKEEFDHVVAVNLRSVFVATKYGASAMRDAKKGGRIINITSIDALHPSMVGLAHYDASKHGVWGFTKNAAIEYANDKIWINAIAPGGIITPGVQAMQGPGASAEVVEAFMNKIPMKRMGDPDEIGKVALFLASEMSRYMTGEQIVVDGGALLS